MIRLFAHTFCVLWILSASPVALAEDRGLPPISAAWAVEADAEVVPRIVMGAEITASLTRPEDFVHGLGIAVEGGSTYVDDNKIAQLDILSGGVSAVWRTDRERYEFGSVPSMNVLDLSIQLRMLDRFHLLYGLAITRVGMRAHAQTGALAFDLGVSLPLVGRFSNMRDYYRGFLQLELRPVCGSIATYLGEEGFADREPMRFQIHGEIALRGGLEGRFGTLTGELIQSSSYVWQRSSFLWLRLRWYAPLFWRRFEPVMEVRYTWPIRPLQGHMDDDAERLYHGHHVTAFVGMSIRL